MTYLSIEVNEIKYQIIKTRSSSVGIIIPGEVI